MKSPDFTGFYPTGNVVQRAIKVLRHQGFRTFWFRLLAEIGYRRVLLLERSLAEPIRDVAPRLPVRFETLQEEDLGQYLAFRPDGEAARIVNALRSGHSCFVARHDGRIVSAAWVTSRQAWHDYLGCAVELAAGDVYLWAAFTLPEYRGQGIAPALCAQQLHQLRDAGFTRAIRSTVPENRSALRAHAKSGFRPVALMGTLRLGPWRRSFRRPTGEV